MADTEQNLTSCFALIFVSPASWSPRTHILCTWPRLPKINAMVLQLYPDTPMASASGWYFNILELKQMSMYESKEQPISKIITVLVVSLIMTTSGVLGEDFMTRSSVLLDKENQSVWTVLCVWSFINCSMLRCSSLAIRSTIRSCRAMYSPLKAGQLFMMCATDSSWWLLCRRQVQHKPPHLLHHWNNRLDECKPTKNENEKWKSLRTYSFPG